MTNTMTRSLIETLVRSKLDSLIESPKRTTRNLADMALHFSTGRFQKQFFEIAQEMLRNENSPYYQLINHALANIDHERLLGFGMNVGYNCFTYGAKIIRKIEQESNFNIPWCISLELDASTVKKSPEHYHHLLNQGKSLGIYFWNIISNGQLKHFIPLMEMNADCAFLFLCKPFELTEEFLDSIDALNNIMFVVEYKDDADDIFSRLQQRRLLYSVYINYEERDIDAVLNGDFLCTVNETNAVFSFFFSDKTCSEESKKLIQEYVIQTRNSPIYKTLPFEFFYDNERLDSIISGDPCSVWFDQKGYLVSNVSHLPNPKRLNLFTHRLSDILISAFPKVSK